MTVHEEDWVPLARPQEPEGFVISSEFQSLAGPFWGHDSWTLRKFIAHLISHFEDPFEHLLDDPEDGSWPAFDVHLENCRLFSNKYGEDFIPLPADWYRELFRAKLTSLRLPPSVILKAKVAYLCAYRDATRTAKALMMLLEAKGYSDDSNIRVRVVEAMQLPPEKAWAALEEHVILLRQNGVLSDQDMDEIV